MNIHVVCKISRSVDTFTPWLHASRAESGEERCGIVNTELDARVAADTHLEWRSHTLHSRMQNLKLTQNILPWWGRTRLQTMQKRDQHKGKRPDKGTHLGLSPKPSTPVPSEDVTATIRRGDGRYSNTISVARKRSQLICTQNYAFVPARQGTGVHGSESRVPGVPHVVGHDLMCRIVTQRDRNPRERGCAGLSASGAVSSRTLS